MSNILIFSGIKCCRSNIQNIVPKKVVEPPMPGHNILLKHMWVACIESGVAATFSLLTHTSHSCSKHFLLRHC